MPKARTAKAMSEGVSQATKERGENDLASFWLYHGVIDVIHRTNKNISSITSRFQAF